MKSKTFALLITLCLTTLLATNSSSQSQQLSVKPPNGMVPDAVTAKKIAEAIWEPIYGAKSISRKKPFAASLRGGVWYVQGTLPITQVGGVPYAEISKADGRILRVWHDK